MGDMCLVRVFGVGWFWDLASGTDSWTLYFMTASP